MFKMELEKPEQPEIKLTTSVRSSKKQESSRKHLLLLYWLHHSLQLCAAAAATAKSLQSCPTLCNPIDGSPPGYPVPGILQARTLECVAISFSNAWKWKVQLKSLSRVQLLATPWTAAYQAPPSMGFFQAKVLEWGAIAFYVDHHKLWKILKEMGIPDHLTCLLRNLYASQEATVRTGHGTTNWFQTGKVESQGCILSPCLLNLYAVYIILNVSWMK